MPKNDVAAKTKEVNELARNYFQNNRGFNLTESFFRYRHSQKGKEIEKGLTVAGGNDSFLLYDSDKIFWDNKFYDMDEKTKTFTERLRRNMKRAQTNELYAMWWNCPSELFALAGLGVAGAFATTAVGLNWIANENNSKQKTEQVVTMPEKTLTDTVIDYDNARAELQQHANDTLKPNVK